ncbi:BaiN/RdsA family NAD(P)/FAD-dependent oxidoreductase [Brumimicrobium oceani]|uniref:Aminoacetone oxidase family FAD-binding enzyme n=1 Tax=Brumimicrobium oceani TaxID=2100725 RepID=A0A2U2XBL8_9FLAO|nr:NAD(P)/FAD-dependent oxidoreductase [Brumimicrobium oceani]PWH85178.1 aminoacetone oxidase family FAD-binding enzyme [Brumimicrobium oceani]
MKIGIIGGGAAGFFAAIQAKTNYPESTVIIIEKSKKLLAKVKISGGGRCNVTNAETSISELSKAYPRGGKQLKKLFQEFGNEHTLEWFTSRDVPLYAQEDQRVFPVSDNSQSIVDCLMSEVEKLGITIKMESTVKQLEKTVGGINVFFDDVNSLFFNKVIVASGGSPKKDGLRWLEKLGHEIKSPVPSLFTFNMPKEKVKSLMGVAVENATTKIQGEKLVGNGPLLITHWGMSGPAVLVLSSFGARLLADKNYQFNLQVNWTNEQNQDVVREEIQAIISEHGQKQLQNMRPYNLPSRLWVFLLEKAELPLTQKWDEIGKKGVHKLIEVLANDVYEVSGKTTFKEEFVTCGGVSLNSVNMKTMESKHLPGLYFAGEVLDIDAITGGYNFQAAWTTGFIAGKLNS